MRRLLSREHFTVDGTLVEAWASLKSFRPKDDRTIRPVAAATPAGTSMASGGPMIANASTTDPDGRLFRDGHGKEARLCFMGHVLMENHMAWSSKPS